MGTLSLHSTDSYLCNNAIVKSSFIFRAEGQHEGIVLKPPLHSLISLNPYLYLFPCGMHPKFCSKIEIENKKEMFFLLIIA
jgi:hypothetical protein